MKEVLHIYGSNGSPFAPGGIHYEEGGAVLHEFTFTAERMGASTVTATLKSPVCLDDYWKGGEYVMFRDEKYVLKSTPSSSKDNTDRRYSHQLSFINERDNILNNVYFYDIVDGNSASADRFRTEMSQVWFHGDLGEFVQRVSDVLSYLGLPYSVATDSTVGTTERKYVSFEDRTVFEVIQEAYTIWEVPFYSSGSRILFGTGASYTPPQRFEYGADRSLLAMQRNNQDSAIITRITGHGSEDNIPYYYPNETSKGTIGVQASGSLPLSSYRIFARQRFAESLPTGKHVVWTRDTRGFDLKRSVVGDSLLTSLGGNRFSFNSVGASHEKVTVYVYFKYAPEKDIMFVPELTARLSGVSGTPYPYAQYAGADGVQRAGLEKYVEIERMTVKVTNDDLYVGYQYAIVTGEGEPVTGQKRTEPVVYKNDWQNRNHYKTVSTWEGVEVTYTPVQLYAGYTYTVAIAITLTNTVPVYKWLPGGGVKGGDRVDFDGVLSILVRNTYDVFYWDLDGRRIRPETLGLEITGSPQEGDAFWQTAEGRVPPSHYLMPAIWRRTGFREQFYNASNTGYMADGVAVGPWDYHFTHVYDPKNPREFIKHFEDIKPTVVGITNAAGEPINIIDDVYYEPGFDPALLKDGTAERQFSRFYVKLKRTDGAHPFNLFDCAIDEEAMSLSMTSGHCGACEFRILVDENNMNRVQVNDDGSLKLVDGIVQFGAVQTRQNDTQNYGVWVALSLDESTYGGDISDEFIMPSRQMRVAVGDSFVILHILLPQSYITAAEERLELALVDYMAANNDEKWAFSMRMSRIWLASNPGVASQLNENSSIRARYNGVDLPLLHVTSYSYKAVASEPLPEVTVELKDTVEVPGGSLERKIRSVVTDTIRVSQAVSVPGAETLSQLADVDDTAASDEAVVLTRAAGSARWTPRTLQEAFGFTAEQVKIISGSASAGIGSGNGKDHWKGGLESPDDLPEDSVPGDMYIVLAAGGYAGVQCTVGTILIGAPEDSDRTWVPLMANYTAPASGIRIGEAVISYENGALHISKSVYSDGEVSAFGFGNPSQGSTSFGGLLLTWSDWDASEMADFALSAALGVDLSSRLDALRQQVIDLGSTGTNVQWTKGSGSTIGTLTIDGVAHVLEAPEQKEMSLANLTGADNLKAIEALTGGGLLRKVSAGTWRLDTNSYLTGNQTITLLGDLSGSGSTSINAKIGNGKVTNAMLAGGIEPTKLTTDAITIGRTQIRLGYSTNSLTFGNAGTLKWQTTDSKDVTLLTFNASNSLVVGSSSYPALVTGSSLALNGEGNLALRLGGVTYLSLLGSNVSITKPVVLGADARRISFVDSSNYLEFNGSTFAVNRSFVSSGEVVAYTAGEVDESGPARSMGGLLNVDTTADDAPDKNSILVMFEGATSWMRVSVDDILALGMLTSASVVTTDGSGRTGTFLKLTFNTSSGQQTYYADLSVMTTASLKQVTDGLTAANHSIQALQVAVNNLTTLADRVFYSETEWAVVTAGETNFDAVPEGKMIYIYEDEIEGGQATYDEATGTLVVSGRYDEGTGTLTLDGTYSETTGTLTI